VFLLLAGGFGYLSYHLSQKGNIQKVVATTDDQAKIKAATTEAQEATWDDLVPIDTIALEVGYRLIALVDKSRN
jgi:flagellar biosynthesis protein FlhA